MWIRARIPRSRGRYGRLVVRATVDGSALRGACPVAAASDRESAAGLGNPENDPFLPGGPPPFGRYRLGRILSTHDLPAGVRAEYGPIVLAFEPLSGDAATAESHGRLLLLVHGGETGGDGRLRPTTGGMRLPDADIRALAALARGVPPRDVTLVLEPMFPLWVLWRRAVSRIGARPVPLPLAGVWGIARPRQRARDDDRPGVDDAWPAESGGGRPPESKEGPGALEPGGGAFGGGGASGAWEDAHPTGSGAVALGAALGALGAQVAAPPEPSGDPGESAGPRGDAPADAGGEADSSHDPGPGADPAAPAY